MSAWPWSLWVGSAPGYDSLAKRRQLLYTAEIVLLIKAAATPTNLVKPGDLDSLDEVDLQQRIRGSKLIIGMPLSFLGPSILH